MSDATDIDGLTVGLTVLARDLAALRDMVTERMSADLGRALGMCEVLSARVHALEARNIALDGDALAARVAALETTCVTLRLNDNGLTALEEKLAADRDAWKARAESAEAMAGRLEAEHERAMAVVRAVGDMGPFEEIGPSVACLLCGAIAHTHHDDCAWVAARGLVEGSHD